MQTAKQAAQAMLATVPDDASFEDIQYRLYVLETVTESLAAVDRGEAISHNEVVKRMAKWLD
jgi:predicted transcriptional regulator